MSHFKIYQFILNDPIIDGMSFKEKYNSVERAKESLSYMVFNKLGESYERNKILTDYSFNELFPDIHRSIEAYMSDLDIVFNYIPEQSSVIIEIFRLYNKILHNYGRLEITRNIIEDIKREIVYVIRYC